MTQLNDAITGTATGAGAGLLGYIFGQVGQVSKHNKLKLRRDLGQKPFCKAC